MARMPADTHCPYCALQCGMTVGADGEVTPREFPTNRGGLCQKGWTAGSLLAHPDRLLSPVVDGRVSSWDAALSYVGGRLRELQALHGPDSVAVLGGGGLTNEKAYLLGRFARVALRTSQIDYNGRFCMSSAAAAGNRAFGLDRGLPFPVTDLDDADVVVLAGANVAELMGHLGAARLVVVDPRLAPTAERAVGSGGLHLQPVPGTDLVLALGLLHAAVVSGAVDTDYLSSRTTGFDDAWRLAAQWWPERAERVCGVAAADMRTVVSWLAGSSRRYVLTARGAEQHAHGVDTVTAWINLALALGLPGTPGSGFGTITGQGNGQGGREHGQKADQLPGYRRIDDPAARAHVAGVWGVDPASIPGPGRSAVELIDAIGTPGGPRALLVFGSNLRVSAPDSARVASKLDALDLLVVADFLPGETARRADVVLPVAQWAEEEGTVTNLEGRVLRRRRALPPPPGVPTDLDVITDLAAELGYGGFPTTPRAVFGGRAAALGGGPRRLPRPHRGAPRRRGAAAPPLPGARPPRRPTPLPRPLRPPRRPRPPRRRRPRARRRAPRRSLSVARHHRPGAGALPVGGADAPRRRTGLDLAGELRRGPPRHRGPRRTGRRRMGSRGVPPRPCARPGPLRRDAAPGHGVPAVPLRRRPGREPDHQPRAGSGQPDAGVQGRRGPSGACER